VSVVAEDKQGRPVVDLEAEELVLSDGGRTERLVSFSAQPLPAATAAALPAGTFTNRFQGQAGGSTSVTVILFDALPERPDTGDQSLWPEIDRAARALNRANLAVYPVDARGLMAPAGYEPERASISREMQIVNRSGFAAMDTLAERTGGKAFYNDNDLGRAFRRAAEDSRAAYRLGYQPSHDEWNGRFREIRIAVKRPGARLRHRSGYFAQPDEPGDEWYRSGVLGAAMWSPVDATRVGLTVRPFPAAPDTLDLEIRIDARDVTLQPVGDGWQGRLDVWLVQLGPGDALLDTVSHVAGLSLDRPTFEQVRQSGELPLVERLKRDRKAVLVRVLVRDVGSGALGSVSIPLDQVEPRPPD